MQPIQFLPNKLEFGDLTIRKAFEKNGPRWEAIDLPSFLKLPISTLLSESRFLFEVLVDKELYRIASRKEDAMQLKEKYPEEKIICLDQVKNLLKGDVDVFNLKTIFLVVNKFNGTIV